MTKEQEFMKQTEEAKFEAFSVMCEKVNELEKEYASLKGLRKYELNVAKLEIEKLEKENAELKEQCSILDKSLITSTKNNIERQKIIDEIKEQLTEAKKMTKEIKWHKVADGDLPSEEGGWVCNQDGLPCYYDWGTEQWLDCEGTQIRTTEWCHMPHKE